MPGCKSREYVRYSHLPLYFCFPLYTRLLRSDDGVQEQEIPGAYYYVEIPDGVYYDMKIPDDPE